MAGSIFTAIYESMHGKIQAIVRTGSELIVEPYCAVVYIGG